MDPIIGASIIGGLFGASGSRKSSKAAARAADRNTALQREFAKKGIQWRVEDAKKAGLHPLSVLGANTIAASPTHVGADPGGAQREFGNRIASGAMQAWVQNKARDKTELDLMEQAARISLTLEQRDRERIERQNTQAGSPLFVPYYDRFSGETIYLPAPDAAESMEGGVIPNPLTTYGASQQPELIRRILE